MTIPLILENIFNLKTFLRDTFNILRNDEKLFIVFSKEILDR